MAPRSLSKLNGITVILPFVRFKFDKAKSGRIARVTLVRSMTSARASSVTLSPRSPEMATAASTGSCDISRPIVRSASS